MKKNPQEYRKLRIVKGMKEAAGMSIGWRGLTLETNALIAVVTSLAEVLRCVTLCPLWFKLLLSTRLAT
jgi:hypothetical protein